MYFNFGRECFNIGEESNRDMCGSGVNILPSLGLLCILTLVGNVLT